MDQKWIDKISLLPIKLEMKKYLRNYCKDKFKLLIMISILINTLNLINVSFVIIYYGKDSIYYDDQIYILYAILIVIGVYLVTLILGICSKDLQSFALSLLPFIYSVIMTEILRKNDIDSIFNQLLTNFIIFSLSIQYNWMNYLYAVIPYLLCVIYPFIRSSGIFYKNFRFYWNT